MSALRTVNIAGGGLAGLGLGIALRARGVAVQVHEAGAYPRHRVCGEFISGLSSAEWHELGQDDLVRECPRHEESVWFVRDRCVVRRRLPEPAIAVSRYVLDAALADSLTKSGGMVTTGSRTSDSGEGWVRAHGRERRDGPWLGLKAHYLNLPLEAGLEMHLGHGGYAGLTALGGGRVNVCALLPAARGGDFPRCGDPLAQRLRQVGLDALAARLERAEQDTASLTGVSHFHLGWREAAPADNVLYLGDQAAIIPPFTGHGMTMALRSALSTAPFLAQWAAGDVTWSAACAEAHATLRDRFARRMRWAQWLHPLLLHRGGHTLLQTAAAARLLPFDWLFRRLRT